MYLIDKEIKARLAEIDFSCDNAKHQFDVVGQIQPCSVDLRLDCVFWKSKSKIKSIDLRKSKLLELSSRSIWHQTYLKEGEYIEIKPNEFILSSDGSLSLGKIIAWSLNVLVSLAFIYSFFYDKKTFFTPDKLEKSKSK